MLTRESQVSKNTSNCYENFSKCLNALIIAPVLSLSLIHRNTSLAGRQSSLLQRGITRERPRQGCKKVNKYEKRGKRKKTPKPSSWVLSRLQVWLDETFPAIRGQLLVKEAGERKKRRKGKKTKSLREK
jgi:hypothetical protein